MERTTSVLVARQILDRNFIGIEELKKLHKYLPFKLPLESPPIPYSVELLSKLKDDYMLILGVTHTEDNFEINLNYLRNNFGVNPDEAEPCFYNQDWYIKEEFLNTCLEERWYLVKKNIFEDSRSINPVDLVKLYNFPKAVLCAYTFFVNWYHANEILWKHDFIWCSDQDHNGDRIYVGKYLDIDGINKNGFSIHRHLTLRNNYGCISFE